MTPTKSRTRQRAVGYVRVSTAEQVHGFGLEVQERAIGEYAKRASLRLVEVCRDEGQSGSNGLDTRLGLARALGMIKAHEAEALVVYRLDRLARTLITQETTISALHASGASVLSVTESDIDADTATRVLVRQVLGAIAEYERAVIRGRMMAGKAMKREQGGYTGGTVAYGLRAVDGEVVPDPEEQRIVQFVVEHVSAGESLRTIASALTEAGYHPRSAGAWHPNQVARIARSSPVPAGSSKPD